jgi:hypothetical protein
MPFGPCPKHGCFKVVEVRVWWRGGDGNDVRPVEEVDVAGCGRLSVRDGLLDVAWFCVQVGWFVGGG